MDNFTIKKLADKFNKTEQEITDTAIHFEKMCFNAIDVEALSVNSFLFQNENRNVDDNYFTKKMIDFNI